MDRERAIKILSKLNIPKECEMYDAIQTAIKSMSFDIEIFCDNIKYFECKSCGCIYYYNSVSDNSLISSMYCPSCGERIVW